VQSLSRRGRHELSVANALHREEAVGQRADVFGRAAQGQDLGAGVLIEVHVEPGGDGAVAVVLNMGVRGDIFNYKVTQKVNAAEGDLNGTVTRGRPNYKANLMLGPWADSEFFASPTRTGANRSSSSPPASPASPRRA